MLMKSTVLICRSLICGNYEKMQLFSIVTKSELGFLKLTLEWRKKLQCHQIYKLVHHTQMKQKSIVKNFISFPYLEFFATCFKSTLGSVSYIACGYYIFQ